MGQVIHDQVEAYLATLHSPGGEVIEAIEAEGRAGHLPLVQPAAARLLRSLVMATGARRVLEIGTCIGYSAVWMAQALPPDGMLITLEANSERAAAARRNIERARLAERISVIVGDANRYLHKVAGPFDLIFQDSDKQLYEPMLDRLVGLLRPGGVLATDNVLWNGEVVDGYVSPPQRDAADTVALRRYNARLASDARLITTFLPVGDGVALSVKLAEPSRRGAATDGGHAHE
jgi:caffeoyl-CoA O-methyltransferase